MANGEKIVLVAGATGQQGGAAARHLMAKGWRIRALTRDPSRPQARALADRGAEVVQGDLNDRASLERAARGVYGIYSVQNFWLPDVGYEGEMRQGKTLGDVAKAAGVQHFVYSSVGGAERDTGIAHFDSKWEIEKYIRSLGVPVTVLRPVYFMENLNYPRMGPQNGVLANPMDPKVPMQMIAVDDIGSFVGMAFEDPGAWIGKDLELAGDALTMPQVAEKLSKVTGKAIRFAQVPMEQVRQYSAENAIQFEWFINEGYKADIPALRRLYPPLKDFDTWLREGNLHLAQ
jgi:uncharacterized protein YbjT (DUF2867 family)